MKTGAKLYWESKQGKRGHHGYGQTHGYGHSAPPPFPGSQQRGHFVGQYDAHRGSHHGGAGHPGGALGKADALLNRWNNRQPGKPLLSGGVKKALLWGAVLSLLLLLLLGGLLVWAGVAVLGLLAENGPEWLRMLLPLLEGELPTLPQPEPSPAPDRQDT